MNTALSILMSALLGIHAMLGCCWHHAHVAHDDEVAGEHNHDDHSPVDHDHRSQGNSNCVFVRGDSQVSNHLTSAGDSHAVYAVATTIPEFVAVASSALPSVPCLPDPRAHQLVAMLRC